MKIITISREYGAGGHTIGKKVAEKLGIPIYDKDIIRATAKASGIDIDTILDEQEDASPAASILRSICNFSSSYYTDTQAAIHDVQEAIIRNFAEEGPCVILGRCADHTLKEAGFNVFNVFLHAALYDRVDYLRDQTGVEDAAALRRMIAKRDSSRHNYYAKFTGKRWCEAGNYDLVLNRSVFGYDGCVELICSAVRAAK